MIEKNTYKTIRGHLAEQLARQFTIEIMDKWNNGQTLYEQECIEFADMFRLELLKVNGYDERNYDELNFKCKHCEEGTDNEDLSCNMCRENIACDECGVYEWKKDMVETIKGKMLCYGCDTKRLIAEQ